MCPLDVEVVHVGPDRASLSIYMAQCLGLFRVGPNWLLYVV